MSQNKSLYTSEIDAQAQNGGSAADGKGVSTMLKRTNFMIGNQVSSAGNLSSEAATAFVSQNQSSAAQLAQKETNRELKAKLKSHNFTLREQKQGGMVNNYFQTSSEQNYNDKGNPAFIRSVIPAEVQANAHKEHYYLGFDQSAFKKNVSTYDLSTS